MIKAMDRDFGEYGSTKPLFIRRTRLLLRPLGSSPARIARSCSPVDRSSALTRKASPLRQRMIHDMKMRNMAQNTQAVYVSAVARFSAFHRRSPDQLGVEDVRDYQLHLISRGLKPNSINPIMGALRFF